jgi:hypothetical protein
MVAEIMKRFVFLTFFLISSFHVFSQKSLLDRKVDLSFEHTSLERIFIYLSNEADFNFSYNANLISLDTLISVHIVNSTVEEVLNALLAQDISYQVSGNHLILLKERLPENRSKKNVKYQIRGYVYNASNRTGLAKVSVFDASGLISALTDSSGYYSINLSSKYEQINLFYSKQNFRDTLIIVQPADQQLNVSLSQLNEKASIRPLRIKSIQPYEPVEKIGIVQRFVSPDLRIQAQNIEIEQKRIAQISILPNIGTNLKMSGLVENTFSLNVFAGYALGVNGLEVGGLVNIDRKDVKGLQIGGLGNVVGGTAKGLQIGGLFNNNRRNMAGAQIAGLSNILMDTIRGAQVAGISNVLRGSMYGWQVAGINNFTTESVDGVQMAGISNIAVKDVDVLQLSGVFNLGNQVNGFQVSGLVNAARGNVGGFQIAGLVNYSRSVRMGQISGLGNIATRNVNGFQLSALFNYAKYVKGGQISLFNLADSVGGTPVGLISIVRKGYHKIELSGEEVLYVNLTYKMGVRKFYNIFSAGIQPGNGPNPVWGVGYGFGSQIGQKKIILNLDVKGTQIFEDVEKQNFNVSFRFTPQLGYRITRKFIFFFGPALNLHVSDLRDPETHEFLTRIAPDNLLIWEKVPGQNTLFQLWLGGTAGFRFF